MNEGDRRMFERIEGKIDDMSKDSQKHRVEMIERITGVETELKNFKDLKDNVARIDKMTSDYPDHKKQTYQNKTNITRILAVVSFIVIVTSIIGAFWKPIMAAIF